MRDTEVRGVGGEHQTRVQRMALLLTAERPDRVTSVKLAHRRPRSVRAVSIGDEPGIVAQLRSLIGGDAELTPAWSREDLHAHMADLVVIVSSDEVPWQTVRMAAAEVDLPVLVVAARWSDEDEQRALESGASGYVALDAPPLALTRGIQAALRGELVFRRRALGRWLRPGFLKPTRMRGLPQLTSRQQEVASLLTTGAADKEIAARLGISVATVQKHVSKVLRAFGASNRAAAVWVILGGADISQRF